MRLALAVFSLFLAAAPAASAADPPPTGTLDLADEADVTFTPGAPEARSGAVAAVGDVNGDGITDFAVGYPYVPRLGRQNAGAVEVVFGRRGGGGPASVRLGELGDGGFEIVGNVTNRYLGKVIAGAGDVNGDGLADILIGSPTAPIKTGTAPGQVEGVVYVVFGRRDSTPVDLKNLGAGGFRIYGAPGDHAGTALAAVGDLDGDGRPEIAVGASNASPGGRAGAGRVMIVLSSRRAGNVDLAAPGAGALEIDGAAAGDRAGYAVAGLPDVNGDGRPDVAIGAPGPAPPSQGPAANGSVAIVHAPAPDATPVDLANLAPGQGATLAGSSGELAGSALASVGDLSGDGVADLVVGAPYAASPTGRDARRCGVPRLRFGGRKRVARSGRPLAGGRESVRPPGLRAGRRRATGCRICTARPCGRRRGAHHQESRRRTPGPSDARRRAPRTSCSRSPRARPIDLALPPPGEVERLVGPEKAHAGAAVAVAYEGATTSVLVGASKPPPGNRGVAGQRRQSARIAWPTGRGMRADHQPRGDRGRLGVTEGTDPQMLRRQALDLLLTKPGNAGRMTGAVEFGSFAEQIFPPLPAPGTSSSSSTLHDTLVGLMAEHLRYDAFRTNFNAGFVAARDQNPGATARILISDGIISPGDPEPDPSVVQAEPPTQVIGLGRITEGGEADQRLSDIAELTGGEYFRGVTVKQLAPVLDTIDAVALCGLTGLPTAASGTGAPTTPDVGEGKSGALPETTTVTRRKPVAQFTTRLVGRPKVVDLTLTWEKTSEKFVVSSLVIMGGKRPTRVPATKLRRALAGHRVQKGPLTLRGSRGASYATLRIEGLRKATAGTGRGARRWDR